MVVSNTSHPHSTGHSFSRNLLFLHDMSTTGGPCLIPIPCYFKIKTTPLGFAYHLFTITYFNLIKFHFPWVLDIAGLTVIQGSEILDRLTMTSALSHWFTDKPFRHISAMTELQNDCVCVTATHSARQLSRKYRLEQHIPNEIPSSLLTSQLNFSRYSGMKL